MYDRVLYSKAVRFQRTAMDNALAIFTTLQRHGDKILKKSLERNPWLPEKSKSTCAGLSDTCIHGSNTLRKFINQGFDEMERLLYSTRLSRKMEKIEAEPMPSRQAPAVGQKQHGDKKATSSPKPGGKAANAGAGGPAAKQKSGAPKAEVAAVLATPIVTTVAKTSESSETTGGITPAGGKVS